jgi:hypothetical protein
MMFLHKTGTHLIVEEWVYKRFTLGGFILITLASRGQQKAAEDSL